MAKIKGAKSIKRIFITESLVDELHDRVVKEIHEAIENKNDIIVYINSTGGSMFNGVSIINHLNMAKDTGVDVQTIVTSLAASASAVIAVSFPFTLLQDAYLYFHGVSCRRDQEWQEMPDVIHFMNGVHLDSDVLRKVLERSKLGVVHKECVFSFTNADGRKGAYIIKEAGQLSHTSRSTQTPDTVYRDCEKYIGYFI